MSNLVGIAALVVLCMVLVGFFRRLWGVKDGMGIRCPECGSRADLYADSRHGEVGRFTCRACGTVWREEG